MNLQRFLEDCMETETVVGNIYQGFVTMFEGDPELMLLWQRMAQDEHDHAMQIKLAIAMIRQKAVTQEVKVPLEKGAAMLRRAKALREQLLASSPSAIEALASSLKLEDIFCQAHLLATIEFDRTDLKALFKKLGRSDEEHLATLQQALTARQSQAP